MTIEKWKQILSKNDVKLIYGLVILLIILASIFPTGLSIRVSEPTIKMYKELNNLKPGSVVWFSLDQVFVVLPELKPQFIMYCNTYFIYLE